jgi:hypothetical protein
MANDLPDDQEETLDDYEAGFLDGYFAGRGIASPNEEQLVEAFQVLDDFIERISRHHAIKFVQSQIDAVVRHAALRKIIGADALRAITRSHLRFAIRRTF